MRARSVAGVTILALWATVVAVHVQREYFKSDTLILAEGAESLAPGSFFYTVEMNGRAIGMASSRLDTIPAGFLFEDLLRLEVPALGGVHPAVVRTRARLGRALQLLDFEFRLESEIGRFEVTGQAREDSLLDVRMGAGSGEQSTTLRLGRSMTLPVALPLRLAAAGRLEEGAELSARVFDPSAMADRPVTVRVVGREMVPVADSVVRGARGWVRARLDTIPTWIIEESYGGVTVRSWLDEDGRLVKAESPMGFTLHRQPYELASQRWEREGADPAATAGYGSVIETTAIASDADLSGLERMAGLVLRLRNVDLEGFDLAGGRQTLNGDTLLIRRETAGALVAGYALPYTGTDGPAARALEATPLIQVDDPRIRETARRIADGSTDPARVARALSDWVHRTLRKDITLSIPSAVQVLEQRQGDCNEHTVLYVALARSLGLPTRTAVGLVHIGGRFYYHAWPEVWLGDDWVAVDPTLGQFPADASHVRFLTGGLARQVELVRLIGRLDLDIIQTIE